MLEIHSTACGHPFPWYYLALISKKDLPCLHFLGQVTQGGREDELVETCFSNSPEELISIVVPASYKLEDQHWLTLMHETSIMLFPPRNVPIMLKKVPIMPVCHRPLETVSSSFGCSFTCFSGLTAFSSVSDAPRLLCFPQGGIAMILCFRAKSCRRPRQACSIMK